MVKPSIVSPNTISLIALMLTPNHWSNFEKCVSLFEKIIFLYLKTKKQELVYQKEKYFLIVMDTVKDQEDAEMRALGSENKWELLIVPTTSSSPLVL